MPDFVRSASLETLGLLVSVGHETSQLDFKLTCDLNRPHDVVELAKDVGAMQVEGGHIIIGADDNGKITNTLPEQKARLFDEATLRAKLLKYLPESLDLMSAWHEVEGAFLAVMCVGPNPNGCAIFKSPGDRGDGTRAFQKGAIYCRHGTASEPATQQDLERILRAAVDRQFDDRLSDRKAELHAIVQAASASVTIADAPAQVLTWRLDREAFAGAVVELQRRHDDVPVELGTPDMTRDALAALDASDEASLDTILDRFASLFTVAVRLNDHALLDLALGRLMRLYPPSPIKAPAGSRSPERLGLDIAQIIEAVGGLAVDLDRWTMVARLGGLRTPGRDPVYPLLLRNSTTLAARAGLLRPVDRQPGQLVSLGVAVADRLGLPYLSGPKEVLDRICQFDFLACLVALSSGVEGEPRRLVYPSFAHYYSHRSESAAVELIVNPAARQALFSGTDDELAHVLRELDMLASRAAIDNRIFAWSGYEDARTTRFLTDHP